MTTRLIAVLMVSLLLVACNENTRPEPKKESTAQMSQAESQYNAQTADKSNEVVCTEEAVTGTRFTKKFCRTRAQIDAQNRSARTMLEHRQAVPRSGD